MVKTREATERDIEQIVLLGEALHAESSYKFKAFDSQKVARFLSELITIDEGCVFVAEDEGQIIGYFIGGLMTEWYSDEITAFDLSVYVEPKRRNGITAIKLFKRFEEWAKDHNAKYCRIGISTNINMDSTSKFYNRLGFKTDGVLFEKRLETWA